MGTLTGDQVRLPENCEHKLPTSCRLTSIPTCCACADERAHAPSYSTYIDGIGFVPRGNRWQRYCWYCKEFWEKRVEVSGLRPAQTRIPEVPDQSQFLERWYEFYRGYRIVSTSDGREERVAVLGEDFKDVSPGCLPRTLEQMRVGQRAQEVRQADIHQEAQPLVESGPTLEEALDQMFADGESDLPATASSHSTRYLRADHAPVLVQGISRANVHAQSMNPAATRNREQQLRRVAALRRELIRMRGGIERVVSGLRDLGERIPDEESRDTMRRLDMFIETAATDGSQDRPSADSPSGVAATTTSTAAANTTLPNFQQRIDEARRRVTTASQARDRAEAEFENADVEYRTASQQLQQVQREQRTMENYTRVFGTREEMIAQGENWESPIGGMFSRAYERFRAAEDVRREQRTLRQVLEDEERIDTDEAVSRRLEELETRERDVWGVPRASLSPQTRTSARPTTTLIARPALPPHGDNDQRILTNNDITRPVPPSTDGEAMLQVYIAMTEQQERAAEMLRHEELPEHILEAYWARKRARQNPNDPVEPLPYFSEEEWWQEDAGTIVRALTSDAVLREAAGLSTQDAAVLLSYFIDGVISEADLSTIDGLLRNPIVIWGTGLPAEWLSRRVELMRAEVTSGLFFGGSGGVGGSSDWAEHHNPYMAVELAAQAFMMSADIRRLAVTLTPPERLQMLYRLQAGTRTNDDRAILSEMWLGEGSRGITLVYYRNIFGETDAQAEQVNQARRQMARAGNNSREELEARRREASNRAFALAAGRRAMQTGSRALIEQMAGQQNAGQNADQNADAGTRAALHRLRVSGFNAPASRDRQERRTTLYRQLTLEDYMESSPGSSRSSSPEPGRGLDANDSGRPEPKNEEDLQVSMECKVCYTQMADIACLPCGHLVMCRWCSEQHSPCHAHDRTRPRRPANCPVCRKNIRQKVRVYRA